jgi:hypothetical protein
MTTRQARQYEMLVRVRAFGKAHQDRFVEGGEGYKAFNDVGAALAEVDAFNGGKQTARRQSRQTKPAAKEALTAQLRRVAHTARVMAKTTPDADAPFPLPTRESDLALLQAGLLFVKEVEARTDAFLRCGLPATFADELQQAVTAFEQAIGNRQAGRTGAAVSQVAIRTALRQGSDAVNSLDVLVRNALGGDIKAMAAWTRDRHVDWTGKRGATGAASNPPTPIPASRAGHSIAQPIAESAAAVPAATGSSIAADDLSVRRAS